MGCGDSVYNIIAKVFATEVGACKVPNEDTSWYLTLVAKHLTERVRRVRQE